MKRIAGLLRRLCACAAVCAAARAEAATIVVGRDAPSIQAAIDAARDGDQVVVPAGVYHESLRFTSDKAVTVAGESGAALTILDVPPSTDDGPGGAGVNFANPCGRSTVIEGITIRGGYRAGIDVEYASPTIRDCVVMGDGRGRTPGIRSVGGGPRIERCTVTGRWAPAVWIDGSSGTEIVDCVIFGNAYAQTAFLPAPGGGGICGDPRAAGALLISGSVVRDNSARDGAGIWLRGGAVVTQNRIVNNATTDFGAALHWDVGDATAGAQSLLWNTVADNATSVFGAVELDVAHDGRFRAEGNVFVGVGSPAFSVVVDRNFPATLEFVDDDFWTTGAVTWIGSWPNPVGSNGNLSAAPLFEDAAHGDYRLAAGSPCIDAADPGSASLPTTDRTGGARSVDGDGADGAAPDMGADERTGAYRPASVWLECDAPNVAEDAGPIALTLRRADGALGAATVRIRTIGFGATEGGDFTALDEVVAFAPGETSKAVEVALADDGEIDPDESLVAVLSEPSGCALAAPAGMPLTIVDGPIRVERYFPVAPGSRWTYRLPSGRLTSIQVRPLPEIVAGRTAWVFRNSRDGQSLSYSVGADGLLLHRVRIPGVMVRPLGRRDVRVDFSPPVVLAPGAVALSADSPTATSRWDGTAKLVIAGFGRRDASASAVVTISADFERSSPALVGPFVPYSLSGSVSIGENVVPIDLRLAPGVGIVTDSSAGPAVAEELSEVLVGRHALAISAVRAPRTTKLRDGGTAPARIDVRLRNGGKRYEVIRDAAMLDSLVSLRLESLGAAAAPSLTRRPVKFPLVLAPGAAARIRYDAAIVAANDPERGPGHQDFRAIVDVVPAALDDFDRSPLLPPVQYPLHAETAVDVVAAR